MIRTPLAWALTLAAGGAAAQSLPPPQNVVSLQASATVEVPKDVLTVVFSTTRDGPEAAAVQAGLKQAVDAVLNEARRLAKPGQVDVRTGQFSLYPRSNPKGGLAGWQGTAEVVVEGKDIAAIAAFAGRAQAMPVGRVGFSLSREAREQVDAEVTAQAIAQFRQRADFMARQFGFNGWTLREVAVNSESPPVGLPMLRMAARAPGAAEESLPVEAGKAAVTATVSGSVQLAPR
jgi:predicted secreted protein